MGHQEVSGDTNPADTLISELQPPELTVENSLLWEAASLWPCYSGPGTLYMSNTPTGLPAQFTVKNGFENPGRSRVETKFFRRHKISQPTCGRCPHLPPPSGPGLGFSVALRPACLPPWLGARLVTGQGGE